MVETVGANVGAGESPKPDPNLIDDSPPPGYMKATDVPLEERTVGIEAPVPSPRPEKDALNVFNGPHYDNQGRAIQPGDTGWSGTTLEERNPESTEPTDPPPKGESPLKGELKPIEEVLKVDLDEQPNPTESDPEEPTRK